MNEYPEIDDLEFTNFKLNYLNYIIFTHNNELLEAYIKTRHPSKYYFAKNTDNAFYVLILG